MASIATGTSAAGILRPSRSPSEASSAGGPAERQLVELLAVFLDAQNADMSDVMVAAGVHAARNVDGELADVLKRCGVAEVPADVLRNGNRTRIGKGAEIETRAGNDVRQRADVGRSKGKRPQFMPERMQVGLPDIRKNQILPMRYPQFTKTEAVCQFGNACPSGRQ